MTSIIDNTFLISDLLKISVEENIFLLAYLYSSSTNLFDFILYHSITDYIVSYDPHETLDSILEKLIIFRVFTIFSNP